MARSATVFISVIMSKATPDETEKLLELARDKSVAGRTALAATLSIYPLKRFMVSALMRPLFPA